MAQINGCRVSASQLSIATKLVPNNRRLSKVSGKWYVVEVVYDPELTWLNRITPVHANMLAPMQEKGLIEERDLSPKDNSPMYDLTWACYEFLTGHTATN